MRNTNVNMYECNTCLWGDNCEYIKNGCEDFYPTNEDEINQNDTYNRDEYEIEWNTYIYEFYEG